MTSHSVFTNFGVMVGSGVSRRAYVQMPADLYAADFGDDLLLEGCRPKTTAAVTRANAGWRCSKITAR